MFVQTAFGCPSPYAGKGSAIEIRSGGMLGEPGEVGHILVVDDDAMVRQTITNYLEEHNVPAASVSSRQGLSRHLEKAHPNRISFKMSKPSPWPGRRSRRVQLRFAFLRVRVKVRPGHEGTRGAIRS